MSAKLRRRAFTLVEVLIVIIIMAVLAAVIIPQFSAAGEDAKLTAMRHTLHTIRSQIEKYRLEHKGRPPGAIDSRGLFQLLDKTNADGAVGSGPDFVYGPYLWNEFPANPLDSRRTVTATSDFPPPTPTSAGGWLYHAATGQIAPNVDGYLTD